MEPSGPITPLIFPLPNGIFSFGLLATACPYAIQSDIPPPKPGKNPIIAPIKPPLADSLHSVNDILIPSINCFLCSARLRLSANVLLRNARIISGIANKPAITGIIGIPFPLPSPIKKSKPNVNLGSAVTGSVPTSAKNTPNPSANKERPQYLVDTNPTVTNANRHNINNSACPTPPCTGGRIIKS